MVIKATKHVKPFTRIQYRDSGTFGAQNTYRLRQNEILMYRTDRDTCSTNSQLVFFIILRLIPIRGCPGFDAVFVWLPRQILPEL